MSEALISKEHFYLNASQYNAGTSDVIANIHVQDTQDILAQNADWLVHVTRFSCDAMNAITYVEKNVSAYWEIRVLDDNMGIKETFNFVLDKDYATPQALVEAMNLAGRMLAEGHGYVEAYRFEIDAEGRFRLISPGNAISRQLFSHIQYTGTFPMNELLGFEQVTQYLRFTLTCTALYAQAVDYIYKQITGTGTAGALTVISGELQRQVSLVLLEMLNGMRFNHTTLADHASVIPSDPSHTATWHTLVDFQRMKVDALKGLAPTPANNFAEALLPKNGSPMLCEWYDHRKVHNVRDPGFKACVTRLDWDTHYGDGAAYGRVQMHKWSDDTQVIPPCNFPNYRSWGWENFKTETDLFPFDSLFGYQITGRTTFSYESGADNSGVLAIIGDAASARELNLYTALPAEVLVGHDMWIEDPTNFNHTPGSAYHTSKGYSVHQIEYISESRDVIGIDYPLGLIRLQHNLVESNLIFTDRRVPFQSRSATFGSLHAIHHSVPVDQSVSLWTIEIQTGHNASIGDRIWFLAGKFALHYEGYEVSHIVMRATATDPLTAGHSRIYLMPNAVLPTQITSSGSNLLDPTHLANTYIFVYKQAGDTIRWAQDRENMKLAATTFSYHKHQHPRHEYEAECSAGGDKYFPNRYHQTFSKPLLHRQIEKTNRHFEAEDIFNVQELADGSGHIVERMSEAHMAALPLNTSIRMRCRMLNLSHKEISLLLEVYPARLLNTYSRGTRERANFPSPWWTVVSYLDEPQTEAFVAANVHDKPLLQMAEGTMNLLDANGRLYLHQEERVGSATLLGNGLINTTVKTGWFPASPIVCGMREDITENRVLHNSCVIWSPLQSIGNSALGEIMYHPIHPAQLLMASGATSGFVALNTVNAAITFDETTKPFELALKVMTNPFVLSNSPVKLWGGDGDFLSSHRPSHIDLIFPFKQLVLQSDDLNQLPEKTHNVGGMKPILSSYTLPSMWPISVDKYGKPSGGQSSPFGTVYFSETGARRFHHLVKQPGGMRQFNISAVVTYKDPDRMPKIVTLPPGGSFDAQLLFMRKVEE